MPKKYSTNLQNKTWGNFLKKITLLQIGFYYDRDSSNKPRRNGVAKGFVMQGPQFTPVSGD